LIAADSGPTPDDEGMIMPELDGAIGWLNSPPVQSGSLRGKVVLIDIWTYSCINSLRQLPYVKSWAAKYRDAGLVVIGVHSPEFGFEREQGNVEEAVRDLKITYPVAIDSDHRVWQAFDNEYWPADYYIDGEGRIRYHHFGEGDYDECERIIKELLKENGAEGLDGSTVVASADGVEAAPSRDVRSPETWLGYHRAERLALPERLAPDSPKNYRPPPRPSLNQWGLSGLWNVGGESAELRGDSGKIVYRFHGRDLHMVLGPTEVDKPVRFKVSLDGIAPKNDHGADSARDGTGEVREPRLYQLIRQRADMVGDRTFEIEFLDPSARAYSFTFG
jgi:thiol-disulfide isomerase/thioredoxin